MKAITNDVLAERMDNHYNEIQKGLTRIEQRLDYMNGTQRKHSEDIATLKVTTITKDEHNKLFNSFTKKAVLNDFRTNWMWWLVTTGIIGVITLGFNLVKTKFFGG